MGAVNACVSREGGECWQPRGVDDPLDGAEELGLRPDQARVLRFLEGNDRDRRNLTRYFSVQERTDLDQFIRKYPSCAPAGKHPKYVGHGPWGMASSIGGDENAWDAVDATEYMVRGATYLSDRKKALSGPALGELIVFDMFTCDTDIAHVTQCAAAQTIQRVRDSGETRQLFVLNMRVVPVHAVAVWAITEDNTEGGGPARSLMQRFMTDMPDQERNKRFKTITRIVEGPWMVKRLAPERPLIIGKGTEVTYFKGDNVLEASISVSSSSSGARLTNAIMRASSIVVVEFVCIIEGQTEDELPEQVLGGFKCAHPDLTNLRTIVVGEPGKEEDTVRPSFLPKN